MRHLRCRCGKAERWDTGEMVHPCQGCSACQTSYASSSTGHSALDAHDWKPRFNANTGAPDRRMCRRCCKVERVEAAK